MLCAYSFLPSKYIKAKNRASSRLLAKQCISSFLGPCPLRPSSSSPYCTNIMTSVLQHPLKIFSPGNITFNAATCPDRKNLRLFYCCDSLIYSIVFLTKYGNLSRLYSLSSHQDAALALSTMHNGPCDLKMVS